MMFYLAAAMVCLGLVGICYSLPMLVILLMREFSKPVKGTDGKAKSD